MQFSVGSDVEICSNEDGFLGSYFAAKVVGRCGRDKFVVEYATLLADDQKGPLKEVVKTSAIRPVPPEIRVSNFNVLDKVDAYDLDGWWVGRVTGRKDGSKYSVYFDSSGDEFDYPASALRIHQEYVNSQWVPSQRREPFPFRSRRKTRELLRESKDKSQLNQDLKPSSSNPSREH